jgi:RHS repeat-associated protein
VCPVNTKDTIRWSLSNTSLYKGKLRADRRVYRSEVALQVRGPSGRWGKVGKVVQQDLLRLRVQARPGLGVLPIQVGITDAQGRLAWHQGQPRLLDLHLEETSPGSGQYKLERYFDFGTQRFRQAKAIRVLHDLDRAPRRDEAPLRFAAPGRLVVGGSIGSPPYADDVPLFIEPRRVEIKKPQASQKRLEVPQEGFWSGARRMGFLDTVVLATGELIWDQADIRVDGRGYSHTVSRIYRSANYWPGPLGYGWHPSWESFLWRSSEETITWLTPSGQVAVFVLDPITKGWEPPPGLHSLLEEAGEGFHLRFPQGRVLTFLRVSSNPHAPALLCSAEDRFGNRIRYQRAAHGQLVASYDALGRSFQYRIEPEAGIVEAVGDHGGRSVVYSYHSPTSYPRCERGYLAEVKSVVGTASYSYRASTRRRQQKVSLLRRLRDNRGRGIGAGELLLSLTYDDEGRIVTQKQAGRTPVSFGYGPNEVTWTMPSNTKGRMTFKTTIPWYQQFAPLPELLELPAPKRGTLRHRFTYNLEGEIEEHRLPTGRILSYEYDEFADDPRNRGNLLRSMERPAGRRRVKVLETMGIHQPTKRPAPHYVRELTTYIRYRKDLQLPVEMIDPAGRKTRWIYRGVRLFQVRYPRVQIWNGTSHNVVYKYLYNHWGQLVEEVDPNGVITQYEHHWEPAPPFGLTVAVPTSCGSYLARTIRDAPGGLSAASSSRPAHLSPTPTPSSTYVLPDWMGRPLRVVYEQTGDETTFEYDTQGRMTRKKQLPTGLTEEFFYQRGSSGTTVRRVLHVQDLNVPPGFTGVAKTIEETMWTDRFGRLVRARSNGGSITQWNYDSYGRLHQVLLPQWKKGNGLGLLQFDYHPGGELKSRTVGGYPKRGLPGITYTYGYNIYGQPNGEMIGSRKLRKVEYDPFGRVAAIVDGAGTRTEFALDRGGNLVMERVIGALGPKRYLKDRILAEAIYYYDELGRFIARRDPVFHLKPFSGSWQRTRAHFIHRVGLDLAGNHVWEKTPEGLETHMAEIDGQGRVRQMVERAQSPSGGLQELMKVAFEFDQQGRLSRVTRLLGQKQSSVEKEYDKHGFLYTETVKGVDPGSGRQGARKYYDSIGRLRFWVDGIGNVREVRYDADGRVAEEVLHPALPRVRTFLDSSAWRNYVPARLVRRREYDRNGQLVRVRDFRGKAVEEYEYDSGGLLVEQRVPTIDPANPTQSVMAKWRFRYDRDGWLTDATDPEGNVIQLKLDKAGRPSKRIAKELVKNRLVKSIEEEFRYDGAGRIIEARSWDVGSKVGYRIRQHYDSAGRLIWTSQEEITGPVGRQMYSTLWEGHRSFDASNMISTLDHPGFVKARYHFSPNGLPIQVELKGPHRYGWNPLRWTDVVRYEFEDDQLRKVTYGPQSGTFVTSMEYDQKAQMAKYRVVGASQAVLVDQACYYDKQGLPILTNNPQDFSTGIEYDGLDRLEYSLACPTPVDLHSNFHLGPWALTRYRYDRNGNLRFSGTYPTAGWKNRSAGPGHWVPDFKMTYHQQPLPISASWRSYNPGTQQLTKQSSIEYVTLPSHRNKSVVKYHLSYDLRGNVVDDGHQEYRYDVLNRLVEVKDKKGRIVEHFAYDALGRRVLQLERPGNLRRRRRLLWFGTQLMGERSSWGIRRVYVRGGMGELALLRLGSDISASWSSQWYYQLKDLSGQAVALASLTGGIEERYEGDGSGAVKVLDSSWQEADRKYWAGNPLVRPGHYWRFDSGLHMVGGRAYHPGLHRFLQRDTAGALSDAFGQGNAYAYAGNNAAAYTDSGNFPVMTIVAAVIGVGMLALFRRWDDIAFRLSEAGNDRAAQGAARYGIAHWIAEAWEGQEVYSGRSLSMMERIIRGTGAAATVVGAVSGVLGLLRAGSLAMWASTADIAAGGLDSAVNLWHGLSTGNPLQVVLGGVGLGLSGIAGRAQGQAHAMSAGGGRINNPRAFLDELATLDVPPQAISSWDAFTSTSPLAARAMDDLQRLAEAGIKEASDTLRMMRHIGKEKIFVLAKVTPELQELWNKHIGEKVLGFFKCPDQVVYMNLPNIKANTLSMLEEMYQNVRRAALERLGSSTLRPEIGQYLSSPWKVVNYDKAMSVRLSGVLVHELRHYDDWIRAKYMGATSLGGDVEFWARERQKAIDPFELRLIHSAGDI